MTENIDDVDGVALLSDFWRIRVCFLFIKRVERNKKIINFCNFFPEKINSVILLKNFKKTWLR